MSETAASLTTNYLVDPVRDYAQVIEESFDLTTFAEVKYTYGDDLLAQHRRLDAANTVSRTFHYDGVGSTRLLTNTAGAITDTYAFTAFGELDGSTGVTLNDYLYTGEQFDPNIGFYYLRARYYNPTTGRFPTMDIFTGAERIPSSLNKYVYVANEPVGETDYSGLTNLSELSVSTNIRGMQRATPTATGQAANLASRTRNIKIYWMFQVVRWKIGPIPVPGIHRFIVAEAPFGLFRYDVGAHSLAAAARRPLQPVDGQISVSRVPSWATIGVGLKKQVARLNARQWLSWSIANTAFLEEDSEFTVEGFRALARGATPDLAGAFNYCLVSASNCIGWTTYSIASAKLHERILK
jgi:RHS repeat-associated protein